MRKKIKAAAILYIVGAVSLFVFYSRLRGSVIVCSCIIICSVSMFLLLNHLLKKTDWYKNNFKYSQNFRILENYLNFHIRNFEIMNVGSNPALFGFFYEHIAGINLSTGFQLLSEDFQILKKYYSYVKKGGTVILPLVPFSSIAQVLKSDRNLTGCRYYSKFFMLLSNITAEIQKCEFSQTVKYRYFVKFPLLYYPAALIYLLRDAKPDERLLISEQPMQYVDLEQDAVQRINVWKKEFNLLSLDSELSDKLSQAFIEGAEILKNMIHFCLERELRPVIVVPPITSVLRRYFTPEIKKRYIDDFIALANEQQIEVLDYLHDSELQDVKLYFNSLFLNLQGRKKFTGRLLSDLRLY